MIDVRDIHSLSDFQRNTKEFLLQIKRTRNPIVLTVNGKSEIVVQDAESFQLMAERLERAEASTAIQRGIRDFEAGEVLDARQAFEEIRLKHAIPR